MDDEPSLTNPNLAYAVQMVRATCCLAGSASYLADIREDLRAHGIIRAVRDRDTPALFDWLIKTLSFQGISDTVAAGYIAEHGSVRWSEIAEALSARPSCPKLSGYWRFYDCRYHKGSHTCSEPACIEACPLPRHRLRNGRLNQMAYSLFLFMRDIADADFVGWIDKQLAMVDPHAPDRLAACREAVIGPLRNVYGVSDKVLAMALSSMLLGAGNQRPLWFEVGATFVAIDTLVHNFLHRAGILTRLDASHPYGDRCYRPGGCADILGFLAAKIDALQFNRAFPKTFPRFVQSAIWRYCAENGLDICNSNRIADESRCSNGHCQLFRRCDRVALHERENVVVNQ
jgi:hypothetical protein